MNVSIVTARRADHGWRDQLWAHCLTRWRGLPWPVTENSGPDGPFSRSGAINAAAARSEPWDVLLIVDGDVILESLGQAVDAVELAATSGRVVYAHDHLTMFEDPADRFADSHTARNATWAVLQGADPGVTARAAGFTRHPNTWSSCIAVPDLLWREVGGFDERFVGWGWEDLAFMCSTFAIAGGVDRIRGDAYHLWHHRMWEANEGSQHHNANMVLGQRYLAAKLDADAMRAIIEERETT